jgi:type II secretion system protein N
VSYFWGALGWIWSQRKFIAIALISALFFFALFFPFDDLSDLITSTIARSTGNQVYLQAETMDLNLIPSPGISAKNVSVETPALPPLEAKYLKISPSLWSLIANLWTIKKAASGDVEASNKLGARLGVSVSLESVLGGDVDLRIRPGSAGEQGGERSKVSLAVDKLNLGEFQKWYDLTVKMQGQASLDTTFQFTPGFAEQPEGEIDLRVTKFNMPASTLMLPYEGAVLPVNLPTLTLANVVLRGRLVGGQMIIEEGKFGQNKDPIYGRIKGKMGLRLQQLGSQVQPIFGAYDLTVEMTTTKAVEKDIGFAFLLFDKAKTPTPEGSKYLFSASGNGFGPPPNINRLNSF